MTDLATNICHRIKPMVLLFDSDYLNLKILDTNKQAYCSLLISPPGPSNAPTHSPTERLGQSGHGPIGMQRTELCAFARPRRAIRSRRPSATLHSGAMFPKEIPEAEMKHKSCSRRWSWKHTGTSSVRGKHYFVICELKLCIVYMNSLQAPQLLYRPTRDGKVSQTATSTRESRRSSRVRFSRSG
jgi:hypothetical protein